MNENHLTGEKFSISPKQLQILQHAAEISVYVTERTLGADSNIKEEHDVNKTTEIHQNIEESSEAARAVSPRLPSSLDHINLDTIYARTTLRESEKKRRKEVLKKLDESHKQLFSQVNENNAIREKLKEEYKNKLKDFEENERRIDEEARRQTELESQEQAEELNIVRLKGQRTLQMAISQGIMQFQKIFRVRYECVANLIVNSNRALLISVNEQHDKLKAIVASLDNFIMKLRNNAAGLEELKEVKGLCLQLDELKMSILEEIRQQNKKLQQQRKRQLEEQQRQIFEQQQQQELLKKQHQNALQAQQIAQDQVVANTNPAPQELNSAVVPQAIADHMTNPPAPQQLTNTVVPQAIADHMTNTPALPQQASNANLPLEATSQYIGSERYAVYVAINKFYTEKVDSVKPLQLDDTMKKYRFACQRAINIPVNAICAATAQHLEDKFNKLYSFLSGSPVTTADGPITINDHPLSRDYCILLMAKKFVSQGDTAISSNPLAAFPVASVIVSLWKLMPDFGQLFLAYTYKESPYLVPYFIPQKRGQTVEEYSKLLGYRVTDGVLENQDMYLKRQAGIARLYSAVMITGSRRADQSPHPYGIKNGWIWLSNFITLQPLPDICATLMWEFLQNAGADMLAAYGIQFRKLLFVIQQQYFPKLSSVDDGGPKARLELLLGKILKEGKISPPQGTLPPNFW